MAKIFYISPTDQTSPIITCPAYDFLSGNSSVNYTYPTATDLFDTAIDITCDPPKRSYFAVGFSNVTCEATDDAGNTDMCVLTVFVGKLEPYARVSIPL